MKIVYNNAFIALSKQSCYYIDMKRFDKKITQEERYDFLCKKPPFRSVIGELIDPDDFYVLGYELEKTPTILVGNSPDQVFECPFCKKKEYIIHSKHIRKSYRKNDYSNLNIEIEYHKFKCKSCLKIFTEPNVEFRKYKRYSENIKRLIVYMYTEEGASLRNISKDLSDMCGIHMSKSTISNILKENKTEYEEYLNMHKETHQNRMVEGT